MTPLTLDAAEQRLARGDIDGARALAEWVVETAALPEDRAAAEALLAQLSRASEDWVGTVRLAGWQAAAGAWTFGPAITMSTSRYVPPSLMLGGMLAGGAVGAGSALIYADRRDIGRAESTTIVFSQQLGMLNGAVIADRSFPTGYGLPLGSAIGIAAGSGVGYYLAGRTPDDSVAAATQAGGYWGALLGISAMPMIRAGNDPLGPIPLWVIVADLGALGGNQLGRRSGLSRGDIRFGTGVGVVAAGAWTLVAGAINVGPGIDGEVYALGLGVTGAAGYVVGARVGRGELALLDGPGWDRVALGPPTPSWGGEDGGVQVSFLNGIF